MTVTRHTHDTMLVRELARQVAEIAHEPRMAAIFRRWRDITALRMPDRAPVWCRPVGCWAEMLPQESLLCRNPWLRELEYQFRQILIKREIDDDSPVHPFYLLPAVFTVEPANGWGVDIGHTHSDTDGGSWAYAPPLKTEADFDRLRLPSFTLDDAKTREAMDRAHDLFGDLLPVKLSIAPPLHASLCVYAAELRGLEQIMVDMLDAPELLHRLMAYLRDAVLQSLDQVEALGVTVEHDEPALLSDPFGPQPVDGRYSLKNLWCWADAQELDQVSPGMWEEFCLEYQRPIFARFGLAAYGCCENLTQKIDGVLTIPNLRIFNASAWTNLDVVLEKVSADYCIMWRQKASDVVFPEDTGAIRDHLRRGASRLQGRPYNIILRELQTLAGHPNRLHEWTRLAKEAADEQF